MLTLQSKGVPTKLLKFFWLKIFFICHRCQQHRWSTLSCEYLRDFWKKFEMVLMGYSRAGGKLIHKKTRIKKSRDTVPLSRVIADITLIKQPRLLNSLCTQVCSVQALANKYACCVDVAVGSWRGQNHRRIQNCVFSRYRQKLFGIYNKLYSLNAFTSKTLYFYLIGDPIWVRYGPEEAFGYLQLPFSQVGLDMIQKICKLSQHGIW